jgi:hypothetical protein
MTKMKNVNLYNPDGSLCLEAQLLLSGKPNNVSRAEWRKRSKEFKALLSTEDIKEFNKIRSKNFCLKWHVNNPEKAKELRAKSDVKWYANNPEKAKKRSADWYANNPEKAKKRSADWYANNPEKAKDLNAKYRVKNRRQRTRYMNDYHKRRKAKDPLYHLQYNMRILGNRVVKQLSLGKKPACTENWQGCTAEELKSYLESLFTEGMTWENYGEWHVDHIRPVCSFVAEEWKQINHYTNLRPLWAEDNFVKITSDKQQKRL